MHTTTGLRLLRALAEHGEPVPSYLKPKASKQSRSGKERKNMDRPTMDAATSARRR